MDYKFSIYKSTTFLLVVCFTIANMFNIPQRSRNGNLVSSIQQLQMATVKITTISETEESYGTGWAFKYDGKYTYIITAAHVIPEEDHELTVDFWPGYGGWMSSPGHVVNVTRGRFDGDIAVIMVNAKIEIVELGDDDYMTGDEILMAGIQHIKPPAMVAIGYISDVTPFNKIIVSGWSYRGHSGGPIMNKRTGKIIGMISMFAEPFDTNHATSTECTDINMIRSIVYWLSNE
jgi:hypothetical protein